jgi:lipopolysaccharide/colanic/teichoic acid biosynthesis glycosyltransferase
MAQQPLQTSVTLRASPVYLFIKHTLDRVAALVALLPLSLYMLYLAWRIRRDSPGPALFKQTRAGRGGKPFTLWKFRTMRMDVDPYGDSPQTGDDPRITPLGRWLRETSCDELPQLVNVLLGQMSLIGPRPLYMQQMAEWNERQRGRLLVKPGLTGLAQINGRGSLTIEEKLEWDVRYVETLCLLNDLGILWRTLAQLWGKEGIYEVRYSANRDRRSEATTEAQRHRD